MLFARPKRRLLKAVLAVGLLGAVVASATAQNAAAPATSSERLVAGLKLNCPVPLEDDNFKLPNKPAALRDIVSFKAETEGAKISVVLMVAHAGMSLNFEGAISGAITEMNNLPGVTSPMYNTVAVTLPGATAKRLTYIAKRDGKEVGVSAVFIHKGQQLWMVQATFPGTNARARFIGETVVKSVRFP